METQATPDKEQMTKDESFRKMAVLTEELVAIHGKDFAVGTLILAARFVAQGTPFSKDDFPKNLK